MAAQHIIVGCDLHDKTMLVFIGADYRKPFKRTYRNTDAGRKKMIQELKQFAEAEGADHIAFAYEASCLGFGLYDELVEAGIDCHVIAPTKVERSPHQRKNKTDEKDARKIFKALREHVLSEDEDEDFPSVDNADSGNHAGARGFAIVQVIGAEGTQLQKRRVFIEQLFQPFSHQEFIPGFVEVAVFFRAAFLNLGKPFFIEFDFLFQILEVVLVFLALGIDFAFDSIHPLTP